MQPIANNAVHLILSGLHEDAKGPAGRSARHCRRSAGRTCHLGDAARPTTRSQGDEARELAAGSIGRIDQRDHPPLRRRLRPLPPGQWRLDFEYEHDSVARSARAGSRNATSPERLPRSAVRSAARNGCPGLDPAARSRPRASGSKGGRPNRRVKRNRPQAIRVPADRQGHPLFSGFGQPGRAASPPAAQPDPMLGHARLSSASGDDDMKDSCSTCRCNRSRVPSDDKRSRFIRFGMAFAGSTHYSRASLEQFKVVPRSSAPIAILPLPGGTQSRSPMLP